MGEADYGPMVVARTEIDPQDLRDYVIAVPGKMTSAYLLLQLALGTDTPIKTISLPFDQIQAAVKDGKVDAGLLIHEGQLTFANDGLVSVLELSKWWYNLYHLPLPLGVNGISRDLDPELQASIASDLKASIEYSLSHRQEAIAYARQFSRDLPEDLIDRFVGMYVNQRTVNIAREEEQAIEKLLSSAAQHGLIPREPDWLWVGE